MQLNQILLAILDNPTVKALSLVLIIAGTGLAAFGIGASAGIGYCMIGIGTIGLSKTGYSFFKQIFSEQNHTPSVSLTTAEVSA